MDPRAPERLDRVDVADAGDRALIEKQHLDRGARATPQQRAQPCDGESTRERLLPERRVERHPRTPQLTGSVERRRIDDRHPAELARVREPHRGPVLKADLATHVALVDVGHSVQKLAGHTERHDERLPSVEIEDDELAAAAHVADAASPETCADQLGRLRLGEAGPPRLELADGAIDDERAQLPRDGFDLGKLRHQALAVAGTSSRFISSQLGPVRTSTMRGTSSSYAALISSPSRRAMRSTSTRGTSATSSSCTCRRTRACRSLSCSARCTRAIAIFMMSAAVPWIGMLIAMRSAALRTALTRLVMSGM